MKIQRRELRKEEVYDLIDKTHSNAFLNELTANTLSGAQSGGIKGAVNGAVSGACHYGITRMGDKAEKHAGKGYKKIKENIQSGRKKHI